MKYKISAYYDDDLGETRYSLSTADYKMDILDAPTGSELLDLIFSETGGEIEVELDPQLVHKLYTDN